MYMRYYSCLLLRSHNRRRFAQPFTPGKTDLRPLGGAIRLNSLHS